MDDDPQFSGHQFSLRRLIWLTLVVAAILTAYSLLSIHFATWVLAVANAAAACWFFRQQDWRLVSLAVTTAVIMLLLSKLMQPFLFDVHPRPIPWSWIVGAGIFQIITLAYWLVSDE